MHNIISKYFTVRCSVRNVTQCLAIQCNEVFCSLVQSSAMKYYTDCCSAIQISVMHISAMQCNEVLHSALQFSEVVCIGGVVKCNEVLCSVVQ